MTTVSEVIAPESGIVETALASGNHAKYNKKFHELVEKAGVGDLESDHEDVRHKLHKKIKINWAAIIFGYHWAIYRDLKAAGWLAVVAVWAFIFASVFTDGQYVLIELVSNNAVTVFCIWFGMLGNSYLLTSILADQKETVKVPKKNLGALLGLLTVEVLIIAGFISRAYFQAVAEGAL